MPNGVSLNNNYQGMDFDMIGWYFIKVSDAKGNLITGRFKQKLYLPPLRRPPIDPSKVKDSGIVLDYALHDFEYDDEELAEFRKQLRKKQAPKPPPKPVVEAKDTGLDNSPFIMNERLQFKNKQFERRMGVDFYIDQIRFLPDKVTVCKLYVEVFNSQYEQIFEQEATLPELNSMSFMPQFFYRRELRKDRFDPTCVVLITIVTVDKTHNETRRVGYAAINLFCNPSTKE